MRKGATMAIASALAGILALFGLGGCTGNPNSGAESGGITDTSDADAPKAIESKDIATYHASFMLYGEWCPGMPEQMFTFDVGPDESGALVARELATGISCPASSELLAQLQAIIDEHGLVSLNGLYRVTAGLPPEFDPSGMDIEYVSGERLAFTQNNDPEAQWAKETYLVFANWFAEQGDDMLLPPEIHRQVANLSITVRRDGMIYRYSPLNVQEQDAIDGETHLLSRRIYDSKAQQSVSTDSILFPDDYYEQVNAIFARYDLRAFDNGSVLYGMGRTMEKPENNQLAALQIHIEDEGGERLYIDTDDPADIEMLQPLLEDLLAYHDALFAGE